MTMLEWDLDLKNQDMIVILSILTIILVIADNLQGILNKAKKNRKEGFDDA